MNKSELEDIMTSRLRVLFDSDKFKSATIEQRATMLDNFTVSFDDTWGTHLCGG